MTHRLIAQQQRRETMSVTRFEQSLQTTLLAESTCINHMSELLFMAQPTEEQIQQGYDLANRLWQALTDTLRHCGQSYSQRVMHKHVQLLQHCNITHSESLLILDQIMMKILRS